MLSIRGILIGLRSHRSNNAPPHFWLDKYIEIRPAGPHYCAGQVPVVDDDIAQGSTPFASKGMPLHPFRPSINNDHLDVLAL